MDGSGRRARCRSADRRGDIGDTDGRLDRRIIDIGT
jgi:hypothetical protein